MIKKNKYFFFMIRITKEHNINQEFISSFKI